jgi:hypothetical protein
MKAKNSINVKFFMLRNVAAKETRKIYAVREFVDKNDFTLLKYPIKFMKLIIKSLK